MTQDDDGYFMSLEHNQDQIDYHINGHLVSNFLSYLQITAASIYQILNMCLYLCNTKFLICAYL